MASKRATMQEILQVRVAMHIAFPDCFAAKGGIKKPLKIGLRQELMIEARQRFPQMSRRQIDAFLRDYCSGHNYLKAIKKGAARVDLAGNFGGFVNAEQAAFAQQRLSALKKKPSRLGPPAPLEEGVQHIGDVAAEVIDDAVRLARLRAELDRLVQAQVTAEIADDWYYTSGRKAKDDDRIRLIKGEILKISEAA